MEYQHICMSCMQDKGGLDVCMHCGFVEENPLQGANLLPLRTILKRRYLVGKVQPSCQGEAAYVGLDLEKGQRVTIREYLPGELVARASGTLQLVPHSNMYAEGFERGKRRCLTEGAALQPLFAVDGIVHVLDYFPENNTVYTVTEYFEEAVPLEDHLDQQGGKIPAAAALPLIFSLGNALDQLHRAGIIHRGVSPRNILLCRGGGYLTGFGAACLGPEDSTLPRDGLTPGYAAPEQYQAQQKRIAPEVDVYGLAALLYHMLTGEAPDEAMDRLVSDRVPAPRQIYPSIREALSSTVMKGLSLDGSKRFRTPREFLDALSLERSFTYKPARKKRSAAWKVGLTASIMILLLGIGVTAMSYFKMHTLRVWVPVSNADNGQYDPKQDPYLQHLSEQVTDPFCLIAYTAVSEEAYTEQLRQAFESGESPHVYALPSEDSSGAAYGMPIAQLLDGRLPEDIPQLRQYYLRHPDAQALPESFSTLVLYYNVTLDAPTLGEERLSWQQVADQLNMDISVVTGDDSIALFESKQLAYLAADTHLYEQLQKTVLGCATLPFPGEGAYPLTGQNLWCAAPDQDSFEAAGEFLAATLASIAQDAQSEAGYAKDTEALPLHPESLEKTWVATTPLSPYLRDGELSLP